MTNNKKEELIATITKLLATLAEAEAAPRDEAVPKNELPIVPSDTVEMLTIKECTEAVKGLNEYTVRQLVTRGEIPYIRCGKGKRGKILIPKAALVAYFSGGVSAPRGGGANE